MIFQRAGAKLLMCDNNRFNTQTTMNRFSTTPPHTRLIHNPYGLTSNIETKKQTKRYQQSRLHHQAPYLPHNYKQESQGSERASHRIGFINVNGLKTSNDNRLLEIANYMRQQSIDIFGICEVNINTRDTNQYKKLVRELRRIK